MSAAGEYWFDEAVASICDGIHYTLTPGESYRAVCYITSHDYTTEWTHETYFTYDATGTRWPNSVPYGQNFSAPATEPTFGNFFVQHNGNDIEFLYSAKYPGTIENYQVQIFGLSEYEYVIVQRKDNTMSPSLSPLNYIFDPAANDGWHHSFWTTISVANTNGTYTGCVPGRTYEAGVIVTVNGTDYFDYFTFTL